jgi:hypothetical protein
VTLTRVPPISPGDRVLMLVGDSVAEQLEVPIETALSDLGWRLAPAAHGGCPVTGEEAITSDGRPLPFAVRCATAAVPTMQDQAIEQDHPDVVVWWDRVSVASFIGPDGEKLVSGSKDWWLARTSALKGAVARFHTTGAVVVFVATEPPGSAIMAARYFGCDGPGCVWRRFQVEHYADVTARWNALMRSYAEQHPGWLAFVNISDVVCHDDAVPCNDAVDGQPARNDGVHYVGDACAVVVGGLLDHLAPILARFH